MNFSARSRLTALIAGMAILVAAIFSSAIVSWRGGRDVKERIEMARTEGAPTLNGLRVLTLDMRSILLAYLVTGDPGYWQKFDQRSKDFRAWLATERTLGPKEKARCDRIEAAFGRYLEDANALAATVNPNAPRSPQDLAQCVAHVQSGADSLLDAGTDLVGARRRFVAESEKSLLMLQQLIFASLLILLIFAAWSVRVIYREMISPLRVRLIETREIAERQEKLAALGVLAAGVAHEIRNPLTAIKARLYTQQKTLPADSAARRDSEFIGKEIERLARIITDFLTFARPAEPKRETVAVAELLRHATDLLAPQLEAAEIALVAEPAGALEVSVDVAQVQQVLINLVQNAAESIGRKGRITLRARNEELPLSEEIRDVVILEVEDTGKGIPREVQERLFDPFFTTKASGMGLGLSIAARIIEKHGGAIRYQTQIDRGTTFGIVLPNAAKK